MDLKIFDFFLKRCHILPTLYNNLVARHQYLLSVRCLGILKNSGALLGSTRVGHGDSLQTLDAFGPWGCQLDRTIRGYSNWKSDTGSSILSVKFNINDKVLFRASNKWQIFLGWSVREPLLLSSSGEHTIIKAYSNKSYRTISLIPNLDLGPRNVDHLKTNASLWSLLRFMCFT